MPGQTPKGWVAAYDILRFIIGELKTNETWEGLEPCEEIELWSNLFPVLKGGATDQGPDPKYVDLLLHSLGTDLASSEFITAGVDSETGEVVELPAAAWRVLYSDEDEGDYVSALKFAWRGNPIRYFPAVGRKRLAHPIFTERALSDFLGVKHLPAEPDIQPSNWHRSKVPAVADRGERVNQFIAGFAAGFMLARKSPIGRDDEDMKAACKASVPGATVDEIRQAYSLVNRELRNPTPQERNAEAGLAKAG